ncbi:GNAT family N-acetyltransferase [Nocardioides mesophilus]|uniref:GNAT family N-acetyltransferase n=1 Tax=Nocardioides mesophilus TaxID=433659 RepID=A0A7G9RF64_9ACTN|nr:GNAT family N-acetyltransferase [Nocardioides mesophilus]QNN54239.1 GNAT family N-acetyltransferase [Nocardioides mesophilus]
MATETRLRDGTPALTWALLPGDRDRIAAGYENLDPESRFHRFLAAVPHLTEAMLQNLVDDVDGVDHVALVRFVFDEPDVGLPAGVARMIRYDDDPTTADVAVTVAEEFRGRGVATALLEELLLERPRGVTRLLTRVAADNPASLAMLRRLGPTTVTPVDEGAVLSVTVELPPATEVEPAGAVPAAGAVEHAD